MSGKATLPRERSYRETSDVAEATCRLIRSVGRRAAEEDPETLAGLKELEAAIAEAWMTAIAGLRASGFSDRDIAAELGVTRQAVEQRWPRS